MLCPVYSRKRCFLYDKGGKYNNMVSGHLQIKKGYYYVVLSYYDNRNKRHVKYVSTGLPEKGNKRKAEAALARVRSEFEPPQEVGELASDMPFAEYLLEWLDIVKVRVKATTYSSYEAMVKSTLEPYFRKKGYTLQGLEARHIQQFYSEKLKTVKPSSVIHYHAVIHQALKYAMKTDLVTQNVAMKVDRPKRNDYQPVFLDAEELQRLFQVVKGTRLELPVLVAAFYGLRRGEVCGLKWDAIDFERGTITIKHTVTSIQVDGKTKMYAQDSAKTKSSMRTLPLVGSFAEYFREVKAAQELNKQVCGNCYNYEYDGYVFVDELGDLMKPDYLTAYFPQYIQKHGLKRMRFHDLRHSCASLLLANGVPLKQIQDWLGHSDFSTTANIYAHLDYSSKLSSAQAMVSGMPLPETVDFGNKWAEIADNSRAG
ncbi:tyrosine-type recombinase/integrase [Massiliimalia timonensis]|uniref:tyrosine-type recombinase/integrase n=1 Tax=Massiliimalia timonensis TaxID=1987501 RepID=UPI002D21A084|nr:tyrosine-type recombinase/integrase [Massiliimalia timonensis]